MAESGSPQDPFEMFRRLWGPLGLPVPGMAMPTLDPKEVEKRVAELRSVEQWLQVNLNMVRFAIQGLEVQRSALLAMGAGAEPGAPPSALAKLAASNANTAASTLLWPWAVMQQAMGGAAGGAAPPPGGEDGQEAQQPNDQPGGKAK
ncbi:MAG TPA: PhaM family polyhydroxyalkanoate granule multifunctional regulatory protein [Burkholderiales bacterium]|nr:PhaM family polyhydroxyalkanoate granule multifunctional regulatory protein [Burkholderiales bacterium]